MEEKCWFCSEKEAVEDKVYTVALKKRNNRKDQKAINIPRCESCYEKHAKGDKNATIILTLVPVVIGLLYFLVFFNVENNLFYVAIIYIVGQRFLTSALIKCRRKIAEPHKSVCDVSENEEVARAIEDGYIEKRRF